MYITSIGQQRLVAWVAGSSPPWAAACWAGAGRARRRATARPRRLPPGAPRCSRAHRTSRILTTHSFTSLTNYKISQYSSTTP